MRVSPVNILDAGRAPRVPIIFAHITAYVRTQTIATDLSASSVASIGAAARECSDRESGAERSIIGQSSGMRGASAHQVTFHCTVGKFFSPETRIAQSLCCLLDRSVELYCRSGTFASLGPNAAGIGDPVYCGLPEYLLFGPAIDSATYM